VFHGNKGETKMTRNKSVYMLAVALLLALALPSMAAPKNTTQISGAVLAKGDFTLYTARSLNGTALQPGDYKVVATDSQISFVHNGKIVAQASIQWKDSDLADNALVSDSGNIKEIHFKGKKQSAVVV
jgi:hypothetical protein